MHNINIGENIAIESDLPQLNTLLQRLTEDSLKTLSSQHLQRVMTRGFLITAFDEKSGLTIGMMTLIPSVQPVGYIGNIEDVCVLKDYEGRGIFSKMFTLARSIAHREGITKLCLTSNNTRERARTIYEHIGFTYHGETGKFSLSLLQSSQPQ